MMVENCSCKRLGSIVGVEDFEIDEEGEREEEEMGNATED